jgi:hypothetical protein
MRVLCIESSFTHHAAEVPPKIVEGEVYVVNCSAPHPITDNIYYNLVGIPGWWISTQFIPISDIDETELQVNLKSEPVCDVLVNN